MGNKFVHCVDSPLFNPSTYIEDSKREKSAVQFLETDDLYHAVGIFFSLPVRDNYTYHAMTSVKLAQAQHVVGLGRANNLHTWYWDHDGNPLEPPPQADIEAYISVFHPSTSTPSALKGMTSNAKKSSIRASVASHLAANRYLHPGLPATWTAIPKCKKSAPSANPYFDFWAWSCRSLEWCGPAPQDPWFPRTKPEDPGSNSATTVPASSPSPSITCRNRSHHVLPILMHHFGCVTPSHEALELLRLAAAGRPIADMGSGNGYWTFMLRRYGMTALPVDNMQSEWRVNWVDDTEIAGGVPWLKRRQNQKEGGDVVLLLVYPVVGLGGGKDDGQRPGGGAFTRDLVNAYTGDTIAVVGTQNLNGYTGFRNVTMDQYMESEHPEWTKAVQVPLPSFAGKDEALFIFQRGERAPKVPEEAKE